MTCSIYSDTSKLAIWSIITFFFMLQGTGMLQFNVVAKFWKMQHFIHFAANCFLIESNHRVWLKLLIDIPRRSTKIPFDVWSRCSNKKGCSNLLQICNFCSKCKQCHFWLCTEDLWHFYWQLNTWGATKSPAATLREVASDIFKKMSIILQKKYFLTVSFFNLSMEAILLLKYKSISIIAMARAVAESI